MHDLDGFHDFLNDLHEHQDELMLIPENRPDPLLDRVAALPPDHEYPLVSNESLVLTPSGGARAWGDLVAEGRAVAMGATGYGESIEALEVEVRGAGDQWFIPFVLEDGTIHYQAPTNLIPTREVDDQAVLRPMAEIVPGDSIRCAPVGTREPGEPRVFADLSAFAFPAYNETTADEPPPSFTPQGMFLGFPGKYLTLTYENDWRAIYLLAVLQGYAYTDGCICLKTTGRIEGVFTMGTLQDAIAIQEALLIVMKALDEEYQVNYDPQPTTTNTSTGYIIRIPVPLTRLLAVLNDVMGRKSAHRPRPLPILCGPLVPLGYIRGFFGGSFGGDGTFPVYSTARPQKNAGLFKSVKAYYLKEGVELFQFFSVLLCIVGVKAPTCDVVAGRDHSLTMMLKVTSESLIALSDEVGFLFCVNKVLKAEISKIARQRFLAAGVAKGLIYDTLLMRWAAIPRHSRRGISADYSRLLDQIQDLDEALIVREFCSHLPRSTRSIMNTVIGRRSVYGPGTHIGSKANDGAETRMGVAWMQTHQYAVKSNDNSWPTFWMKVVALLPPRRMLAVSIRGHGGVSDGVVFVKHP
ncbi:hypothetical protein BGZ82_003006 [Podila clonocystis]|nr:hypothetical protein BGZ82_003006 [Podila clonocystis]